MHPMRNLVAFHLVIHFNCTSTNQEQFHKLDESFTRYLAYVTLILPLRNISVVSGQAAQPVPLA